ncbi:hypothetical protein [Streptomyces sp. NPDC056983]
MSKVIFIPGAGRGPGKDIGQRALDAGHQVMAAVRDPRKIVLTVP